MTRQASTVYTLTQNSIAHTYLTSVIQDTQDIKIAGICPKTLKNTIGLSPLKTNTLSFNVFPTNTQTDLPKNLLSISIIDAVKTGENLWINGEIGTGKHSLLQYIATNQANAINASIPFIINLSDLDRALQINATLSIEDFVSHTLEKKLETDPKKIKSWIQTLPQKPLWLCQNGHILKKRPQLLHSLLQLNGQCIITSSPKHTPHHPQKNRLKQYTIAAFSKRHRFQFAKAISQDPTKITKHFKTLPDTEKNTPFYAGILQILNHIANESVSTPSVENCAIALIDTTKKHLKQENIPTQNILKILKILANLSLESLKNSPSPYIFYENTIIQTLSQHPENPSASKESIDIAVACGLLEKKATGISFSHPLWIKHLATNNKTQETAPQSQKESTLNSLKIACQNPNPQQFEALWQWTQSGKSLFSFDKIPNIPNKTAEEKQAFNTLLLESFPSTLKIADLIQFAQSRNTKDRRYIINCLKNAPSSENLHIALWSWLNTQPKEWATDIFDTLFTQMAQPQHLLKILFNDGKDWTETQRIIDTLSSEYTPNTLSLIYAYIKKNPLNLTQKQQVLKHLNSTYESEIQAITEYWENSQNILEKTIWINSIACLPRKVSQDQSLKIANAIDHDNKTIRLSSIWAIGQLQNPELIPLLHRQRKESTSLDEELAILNAFITINDPSCLDQLTKQPISSHNSHLNAIMKLLQELNDKRCIPIAKNYLDHPDTTIQLSALQIMGHSHDPEILSLIEKELESTTETDRLIHCINALEKIGNDTAIKQLCKLITSDRQSHPKDPILTAVANALKAIHTDNSIAQLADTIKSNRNTPQIWVNALSESQHSSAEKHLIALLDDPDHFIVHMCLEALCQRCHPKHENIFLKFSRSEDRSIKKTALTALSFIDSKESIDQLISTLKDPDIAIRQHSQHCLENALSNISSLSLKQAVTNAIKKETPKAL